MAAGMGGGVNEFAIHMMALVASRAQSMGEWVQPKTTDGFLLVARWWYWHAKESKSGSAISYAKALYAKSRNV